MNHFNKNKGLGFLFLFIHFFFCVCMCRGGGLFLFCYFITYFEFHYSAIEIEKILDFINLCVLTAFVFNDFFHFETEGLSIGSSTFSFAFQHLYALL